jgi:hypothetical protein
MAPPKTMHGARAQLIVDGEVVGIFTSFSYGLQYDTQDVYILGRLSAAEIVYTAQETVNCTASGWRIVNNGPHRAAKVPTLQELLEHEYITLAIFDRQSDDPNARIATIQDVRPTGYSTTINSRQLQEVSVSFKGILVSDESGENAEPQGSSNLP